MSDEHGRPEAGEEREWEPYVRAWRKRLQDERRDRAVEAEIARKAALRAAAVLVEEFGCTKVYLFGSLTGKGSSRFGQHSDVDLAVEGLPAARYLAALAALENVFQPGTRFDLVRLEDAVPSLVARVHSMGEMLADGAPIRGARRRSR
jgi:predicted nucleotidyltransferase